MKMSLRKIVSGGQSGVDRAAFDAAIAAGIEIGGFVPKGRLAEDGEMPARYTGLIETDTASYDDRTRLNVLNSDATLILSSGILSGGSKLTQDLTISCGKPLLHIDFLRSDAENAVLIAEEWLASNAAEVLNIAGPRSSEDADIYSTSLRFLIQLFAKIKRDEADRPRPVCC